MAGRLAPLFVACLVALAAPATAGAAPCGLPDTTPLWIDYGSAAVPFWKQLFAQPGIIVATSGLQQSAQLRAAGAHTVFFDLNLNRRVGTPTAPADPATIVEKANRLFDFAVASTGCSTPLIAENELAGASTATPWSEGNAQYRANVLTLLRALAARGARPFLLVPTTPFTGDEAAEWWRQVAQVADIVREVFFENREDVVEPGPLLGSRRLRQGMRRLVQEFTEIGIPASRIGLMLEFESGPCCRAGLAASDWFRVIKLETLAAQQVASELGISSIWSWGWATFGTTGQDPDKPAAACVYLWTRDRQLCDGPAAAGPGFNASLHEGQIDLSKGVHCSIGDSEITVREIAQLAALTGDREVALTALLERAITASRTTIDQAPVLAAERAVVALRFGGSRAHYLATLTGAHASPGIARGVMADQLRRERIRAALAVAAPTTAAVARFYRTYETLLTRLVEAVPAPPWLGGRRRGIAIESLAPAPLFPGPLAPLDDPPHDDRHVRHTRPRRADSARRASAGCRPAGDRGRAGRLRPRGRLPAVARPRGNRRPADRDLRARPATRDGRGRAHELPSVPRPRLSAPGDSPRVQSVEYLGCTFSPRIFAIALLVAIAASPMPIVISVILLG